MTDGKDDGYFRQERKEVEVVIPDDAEKILDVGCGEGILGKSLLNNGVKEVIGIEFSQEICDRAKSNLTHVICADIEILDPGFEKKYFDCLIFADILEHLKDPLAVLKKYRKFLSDSGCIVASIPNVGYYRVIDMLARGQWTYGDHGILDRTHIRFFTRKEIETLFINAGLEITDRSFNIHPEYENLDDPYSGNISFGRVTLNGLSPEEMRDLFVFQYIVRARKVGYDKNRIDNDVEETVSSETSVMLKKNKNDSIQKNATGIKASNNGKSHKIAIVRGANLNKWEMQNYEPMLGRFDLTAYTTDHTNFDITKIKIPVVRLPFQNQGLLTEMIGLEDALSDKDLVFSADITYKFSAQAVRAKQHYGCKVICLEWENIPYNFEEYEEVRHIKKIVRNGADHFIAVTKRAKEALMIEGVAEEKIDVIPMGVDLNVFRPVKDDLTDERSKLGINSNSIVVLFIGRMVWEKGIYDFLHAAGRISRDTSLNERQIKYIIVGKGPELEDARARAGALGISRSTTFIEEYPYDDMYKLHNIADFFVLPSISTRSWQEQFGMVLIESMACGTPVISSYSGSISEVVGDAGILVQPNDHLSLYKAMHEMIVNKDVRDDLGKKALKRAKTMFDAKKISDNIEVVFKKVMFRKNEGDLLREAHEMCIKEWERGNKERAFSLLCETFEKDQDNKSVLDSVISMGMKLEQYETVEMYVKDFLQCHPANLDALISLSEVFISTGREEQAEKELKKVLIFEPQNSRAHLLLEQIKANQSSINKLS